MKLKSLDVLGFKSFAERTILDFTDGVTAIVGPNGCGKSNVVDAVKWVLGEQSVKSLRGREMTDVIFNGSERRPAMGMAEVTLTFDNADGTLPLEQTEVAITRRLFRSGESEYQINRKTCRLRDLRELFMGTGLGPGGYSFMEQGKIDSVLASNPNERRKVFEEAAGISRFRARRHETELKLDKVDANLLRLADIVDELERRERSLKIQAGKAQRYREYRDAARELQARVALHRFDDNARREAALAAESETARARRDALVTDRDARRHEVEQASALLSERGEALTALRERAADLSAREAGAREMGAVHTRRLLELTTRSRDRREEIEDLEREVRGSAEERERALADAAEFGASIEGLRSGLAEEEASYEALRLRVRELEEEISVSETELRRAGDRRAELGRRAAGVEAEVRRWGDEVAAGRARIEETGERRERLDRQREELAERIASVRDEVARREGELSEKTAELEALDAGLAEVGEERGEAAAERSRLESRIEVLDGHVRRNEGLDEGVRLLLEERAERPDFLPDCRGLLLDHFRAEMDVADAVEAALGEAVQALVVETVEDALKGAAFLAEKGVGRAAFLPLEAFRDAVPTDLPRGVAPRDEVAARLLGALLSGLRIVAPEELAGALDGRSGLVVTTGGDRVRDGRVLTCRGGESGRGLLAVRAELEDLRGRREGVASTLEVLEKRLEDLRGRRPGAVEDLRAARRELDETRRRSQALDGEERDLLRQGERLEEERERVASRIEQATARLKELEAERSEIAAGVAEVESDIARREEERRARSEGRSGAREELDRAARSLESRRLELASTLQRVEALETSANHLAERHERARRAILRYREELDAFSDEHEGSRRAAQEAEEKAETLAEELGGLRAEIETAERGTGEVRARHEELSRALRGLEGELEGASETCHRLAMQLNEVRVNQENLVEHVREELELELPELHARASEDGSLTESAEGAEVDWRAIEAELEEIRDKISKLGNVNLAAIEDLEEVQERLEFLVAQRDDLFSSKGQLSRVLASIEEESTRLFRETFDKVREHFQVMFRKLFGGGRADIQLLDPENVLESGIEITARPPGKEMRGIELLSGGERTLTAVALLFAIIRAHPCPCCLMDEVDAALDEDNTERFGMLLDEFVDRTQFIIITHSRRTMARADVLFGVTMAERGVSRPVGVRFDDIGEDGEIREEALQVSRRGGNGRGKGASRGSENGGGDEGGEEPGPGAGGPVVAGEILVEMSAAAGGDADDDGGRVRPLDLAAGPGSGGERPGREAEEEPAGRGAEDRGEA